MLTRVAWAALCSGLVWLSVLAGPAPQDNKQVSGKKPPAKEEEPKAISINDQLTNADAFDAVRTGCHHKVHIYKMAPGRTYVIRMHSNQMDSYLRLEDSKGNQLAFDDDGDGFPNAKIVFNPTHADNYRIIATTFGNGMKGAYTLMVRPSGVKKLLLNTNGQLTNADPFDVLRQSCHHKLHTLKMTEGKTYTIQLTTNQFNPCLRLEDAAGNQIQDGPFTGGSTMLEYSATKTDTYRIIVTTLGANQTGTYSLVVSQE